MWVWYTKGHRNFSSTQIQPQIFSQEVSQCIDTTPKALLNTQNNPRHTVLRMKPFLWSLSGWSGSECSGQRGSCASALLLSIWAPWHREVLTAEQLRGAAPRGEYLWRHPPAPVSAPRQLLGGFGALGRLWGFALLTPLYWLLPQCLLQWEVWSCQGNNSALRNRKSH